MKKKIFLIMILFASVGFAQSTITLSYGTPGDSVKIIDLHESGYAKIYLKGNANSPVDSIRVQEGIAVSSNTDTIWGGSVILKDSVNAEQTLMINNSAGKSYLVLSPAVQLLKFILLNHRGTLPARSVLIGVLPGE